MTKSEPGFPPRERRQSAQAGLQDCADASRDQGVSPKRVLVIGSDPRSLVRFRGHLIGEMVRRGHSVIAAASGQSTPTERELDRLGASYRSVSIRRKSLNPLADLRTATSLLHLMWTERPDLVLAYTAKPVVYGALAARRAGIQEFHALITGLGSPFAPVPSFRRQLARRVLEVLYRVALRSATGVIFQNLDDQALFEDRGLLNPRTKRTVVAGSGVNLEHFAFVPSPPPTPFRFLLMTRLLPEKGVADYVEAARMLRARGYDAVFGLLGPHDDPPAIDETTVRAWTDAGVIEYFGEQEDVRPYLAACHAFVLPSYYREGVPRAVLEAMAVGRPVITTATPGCRETVNLGSNGFLVPTRDPTALADAMEQLVTAPERASEMGRRSRDLAARRFCVMTVTAAILRATGLS